MVKRQIEKKVKSMAGKFPVLTVTGTRQCGKSTLLRNSFPDYRYISLEDRDMRDFATDDPRGFLKTYGVHVIIDEAQRVPDLFSYIQTTVDDSGSTGQYVLSGSHNFLLMEGISQSLAGRTAVLTLAPFSISELTDGGFDTGSVWRTMLWGGYPRMYDANIPPQDYFPSYVSTYIEKDVRSIRKIASASDFTRFVRLCATRSGQVLKISELANDARISVPTASSWLSILEQSYIIFLLQPYYNNYSKRLTKSPKLYFHDTGLLCYMLGIETEEQLTESDMVGAIFENLIISEYIKSRLFSGREPACYYWRDTNGNEIDLLTECFGKLYAYEIKIGETMNRNYLKTLSKFQKIANIPADQIACIYRGDTVHASYGSFVNYMDVDELRCLS